MTLQRLSGFVIDEDTLQRKNGVEQYGNAKEILHDWLAHSMMSIMPIL
jgi:hypothetical protein